MTYIVTNKSANSVVVAHTTLASRGTITVGTLSDDIIAGQASGLLTVTQVTAPVSDAANGSVTNSVTLVVGAAAVAPGRMIRINATAAGNVVLTLSGGSTETLSVTTGYMVFPYAVTQVVTAGTTAVASYANLY